MKRTLPVALIAALAFVVISITPAHAKWGDGPDGEGGRGRGMDKAKIKERIELIKMWKIIEVLDLDQETAMKLFPVIHDFDVKQEELENSRRAMFKQAKEELEKDAPDPAVVASLIDQFKQSERDKTELRIQQIDALSKILSQEQVAKLIILAPKFEHRVRELLHEAKERHRDRKWSKEREDTPPDFERGPRFK